MKQIRLLEGVVDEMTMNTKMESGPAASGKLLYTNDGAVGGMPSLMFKVSTSDRLIRVERDGFIPFVKLLEVWTPHEIRSAILEGLGQNTEAKECALLLNFGLSLNKVETTL
jgi:hypothetical protein